MTSRSSLLGNSARSPRFDTGLVALGIPKHRGPIAAHPLLSKGPDKTHWEVIALRREAIAMAVTSVCLLGASACQRPASDEEPRASSPASSGQPVHPSVPGRNIPCPREGGLDKAGYPCEPPASGADPKGKP